MHSQGWSSRGGEQLGRGPQTPGESGACAALRRATPLAGGSPRASWTSKHLRRRAGSERIGDQNAAQDVQDAATWLFLASSIVPSEKSADQKRPYVGTTYNWPGGAPVKKQGATLFD